MEQGGKIPAHNNRRETNFYKISTTNQQKRKITALETILSTE